MYSSAVFLDSLEATSATRWEPSGMNLLNKQMRSNLRVGVRPQESSSQAKFALLLSGQAAAGAQAT